MIALLRRLSLALGLVWSAVDAGEFPVPEISLSLPIDCVIGKDCFIQNHVDRDPGPGFRDYACGSLGYDGHTGLDIRVPDLPAMGRGIAVIAAAPGRVRALRDGMTDIDVRLIGAAAIAGRKAGNTVVIDHGGGWETGYSHLRRGSIRVAVGDKVVTGDVLGLIGMSGNAAFPHVHFIVRRRGVNIDPFRGIKGQPACGVDDGTLWDKHALAALSYTPSGILAAGFATRKALWSEARRGDYPANPLKYDSPALVFWTSLFGGRAGDRIIIRLIAPDGAAIAKSTDVLKKDKAQNFNYVGRKRRGDTWPEGVYRGEYRLYREINGVYQELLSATREIALP